MRHETFCLLGGVFVSPGGEYEARPVEYELAGANAWLHQDDRQRGYVLHRAGESWRKAPMAIAPRCWWARLVSTETWPPEGRLRIAIDDQGTLTIGFDGDSHLSRIWSGRPSSPWQASLSWNAPHWRISRRR
jgi:hypothetical protein